MAEESQKGGTQDASSTTAFLTGNDFDFGHDLDVSLSSDYNKQTSTTYEHRHEVDEGSSPLRHSGNSYEKDPSYGGRSDGVTSISFDAANPRHPSHLTLLRKIGRLSAITLIISTVVILGILGFLSFLWHGGHGNSFWHWIMVNNYAPRTISISTFFLRYAVDFQAGIAAAMLAALALEFHGTRLHSAASLSIMRSGLANPLLLLKSTASGVRSRTAIGHLALAILLFLTTTALQLSSTALLTDLRTGLLPGQQNTTNVAVDFFYNRTYINITSGSLDNITEYYGGYSANVSTNYALVNRATAWLRNPGQYPTFAEYAEPAEKVDGVDDTGVLLRAFIPSTVASERETLRNYSGKAVVLDSRVSCHRPSFSNASSILEQMSNDSPGSPPPGQWGNVTGRVTTDRYTDRSLVPDGFTNFTCYLDGSYSLCQLAPILLSYTGNTPYVFGKTDNLLYPSAGNLAGGLLSQFSNLTSRKFDPPTNEVIDRSWHCQHEEDCVNAQKELNGRLIPTWGVSYLASRTSIAPNVTGRTFFEGRDEWMDFYLREEQFPPHQKIVSFSLCFAAWDVARLDVDMHADSPRFEPHIEWDPAAVAAASMSVFDNARWQGSSLLTVDNFNDLDPATPSFDGILNQLGQISSNATSAADRGIMTLKNRTSWIPEDPDGRSPIDTRPYVQQDISYDGVDAGSLSGIGNKIYMTGNRSIFMTLRGNNVSSPDRSEDPYRVFGNIKDPYILADPSLGNMFMVNMQKTNNSVAKSLSSLITVLSSMAYYDQYPQFMTKADAQQVVFVNVLYPQAVAGYAAVLVVALIHLLLVAAIVVLFLKRTRFTLLGNCWSSIAQLVAPETEVLLRGSAFTTDGEVKRDLIRTGRDTEVKIRSQDGGDVDQG